MRRRGRAGAAASALARGGALLLALLCIGIAGASVARDDLVVRADAALASARSKDDHASTAGDRAAAPCAAWLSVDGTPIDLPVATLEAGTPADYYLTHDLWGAPSSLGCPFIDARCAVDGVHVLVFGHRIGWGDAMFTPLWNRYEQHAFDELGTARWEAPSGEAIAFQPLCALRVPARYAAIQRFTFADTVELRSWLGGITSEATARAADWRERIAGASRALTLATCSEANGHSETRTLVIFVSGEAAAGTGNREPR